METAGTVVEVHAADVSDRPAMEALFARFGGEWPELRGIVHAAVAMSQCPLRDLDEAILAGMLASKVAGTRNLLALVAGKPLDFAVLFSSTTALLGAGGWPITPPPTGISTRSPTNGGGGFPGYERQLGHVDEMRLASAEDRRGFSSGPAAMPSSQALEAMVP